MNSRVISALPIFLSFLLCGCMGIGGFWMTGDPSAGKDIKPYGEYWVKEGLTVEGRREDSWACGAARTVHGASHVVFSDEQEKAERRPEEKDVFAARARLSRAWVECMKAKGYRYAK